MYSAYGSPDVLEYQEVEKPTPENDEVLVRVRAASINLPDWALLRGKPFVIRMMTGGLLNPKYKILGADIAGRVEAVGRKVERFHPGDEVFGDISACGFGGFAEYVSVCDHALALKPKNTPFAEAAAVPMAAVVALQGLRDRGHIQAGQKVLIHGASGGIGTFAVQIAKAFGGEVTAVCSTRNIELVRAIGADRVIDYTKEDFAAKNQRYDLILAAAGYRSIFDYARALNQGGVYVVAGGATAQVYQCMLLGPWISMTGKRRMVNLASKPKQEDLMVIKELIEEEKVKPVIDKRFSLREIPEALEYYGEGHTRGKVVITMDLDHD